MVFENIKLKIELNVFPKPRRESLAPKATTRASFFKHGTRVANAVGDA